MSLLGAFSVKNGFAKKKNPATSTNGGQPLFLGVIFAVFNLPLLSHPKK
jgi:hypothetical protein